MAIGLRAVSSNANDVTGGTLVCNKPSGVVSGDLLVAIVGRDQDAAATTNFTSSGWTLDTFFSGTSTYATLAVLWKVAGGSEPATYTFTSTSYSGGPSQFVIHIVALTGASTASPIAVSAVKTDAGSANANIVAPTITIPAGLSDPAWLFTAHTALWFGSASWTPPSGMTERIDDGDVWMHVETNTESRTAGATGTRTASFSQTPSLAGRAISFAIRPGTTDQTITTTGIATGFVSGAASVTTGPVDVVPGGIATAEVFGPTSVTYEIIVDGIASAEAFGLSAIDGGVRPIGIPSGQAFGSTVVTVGAVTLSVTGIPSEYVAGDHVLEGSVLDVTTGIAPTGPTFGAATVDPGPVDIEPVGIPTLETFGPGNQVTQVITALKSEILVRPKPRVTYEIVCMAKIPQASGPPKFFAIDSFDWENISYKEKISDIPTLDFSCKFANLPDSIKQRLVSPSEMTTEIWVNRNSKLIFAGPLVAAQVQGESISISANGILYYLSMMLATQVDRVFKNQDQFTIVKTLIDERQLMSHAHVGINTVSLGLSGVNVDVTYIRNEQNVMLTKILELAESSNGFDIEIDPSSRNLDLHYPRMGVDRSSGPEAVIFDDRNVTETNIMMSIGHKDVATDFYGIGTGSGQDGTETYFSYAANDALRARYGRTDYWASFRDISSQAQLDALVVAMRDARKEPLWIPGPNVTVTPDSDLSSYSVGDTVFYQLHDNLDVKGAFRLLERDVSVSSTGVETVSATFV